MNRKLSILLVCVFANNLAGCATTGGGHAGEDLALGAARTAAMFAPVRFLGPAVNALVLGRMKVRRAAAEEAAMKNGLSTAAKSIPSSRPTAGYAPVAKTGHKVPAGTEVPFSKVMDRTFASDYIGSDILTVAEFVANGTGAWAFHYPMDGKVVFRSRPPGAKGEKNPLSGEVEANFVVFPKEKSDIVFTLKPGDLLKLRGGTSVSQWRSNDPSLVNMNIPKEIIFEATSIEKQTAK